MRYQLPVELLHELCIAQNGAYLVYASSCLAVLNAVGEQQIHAKCTAFIFAVTAVYDFYQLTSRQGFC
jgi:hypothetical protein